MTRSSAASPTSTPRNTTASSARFDILSPKGRSALMARVRQRHTGPEQIVRSLLHRLGLRFTVDGPLNRSLPSRPDIVLPRWRTVILVHGCFWHRHTRCRLTTTPRTRAEFWNEKFAQNISRDRRQRTQLKNAGWRVLIVGECETRLPSRLALRLARSFSADFARKPIRVPSC
jgi:DNA mismatch endonuclease, patch repair protein